MEIPCGALFRAVSRVYRRFKSKRSAIKGQYMRELEPRIHERSRLDAVLSARFLKKVSWTIPGATYRPSYIITIRRLFEANLFV